MDVSRRSLLIGTGIALTSGSVGFASGMAFQSSLTSSPVENPTNTSDNSTDTTDESQNDGGLPIDITMENRPRIGSTKAPVRLVYWNDYQCPFCYRFDERTLPTIVTEFVSNGDVQIIIKPIALFGDDSVNAALSSNCVEAMDVSTDVFFNWHNRLYEEFDNAGERNTGWASPENLRTIANESFSSINGNDLQTCVENNQYADRLNIDDSEARQFDMTGTPFFVAYNVESEEYETITGAQPYSSFKTTLNSLL